MSPFDAEHGVSLGRYQADYHALRQVVHALNFDARDVLELVISRVGVHAAQPVRSLRDNIPLTHRSAG